MTPRERAERIVTDGYGPKSEWGEYQHSLTDQITTAIHVAVQSESSARERAGWTEKVTPREIAEWIASNFNDDPDLIADITTAIQAESNAQLERGRRPLAAQMQDMVDAATRTEPDYGVCLTRCTPETLRLLHVAMGLCTEAAEFVDVLKKHIFYGKPIDHVNLIEELGDCTWYERVGVAALEVTYLEMLERNIAKLKARFPERYSDDAAINRNLTTEREILEGRAKVPRNINEAQQGWGE